MATQAVMETPVVVDTALIIEKLIATDTSMMRGKNLHRRNDTQPLDGKNTRTVGLYDIRIALARNHDNMKNTTRQDHRPPKNNDKEDAVSSDSQNGKLLIMLDSKNLHDTSGVANPVSGVVVGKDKDELVGKEPKEDESRSLDIVTKETAKMITNASAAEPGTTSTPCSVINRTTKSRPAKIVTHVRVTPLSKTPDDWGLKAGK